MMRAISRVLSRTKAIIYSNIPSTVTGGSTQFAKFNGLPELILSLTKMKSQISWDGTFHFAKNQRCQDIKCFYP